MDPEETARRSAEQMWSTDAASRMLGMKVDEVGPGIATVSMTVREDMINGWELCHGGLVASLADSAFAVACNSRGTVTVAAGFDVTFVSPARLGDRLLARAVERSVRGRSGLYDVTVSRCGDGEVVAEFRGRSHATGRANPAIG
jgi:acyl-CoA thioesterase